MPKLKYKCTLNVLQLYFYNDIIVYFGINKPIKPSVYESRINRITFTMEAFLL